MAHFTFQSYAWSLGTTSFRMADFHRKVEEQLMILHDFWQLPENQNVNWKSNPDVQYCYYEFAYERGFITGDLADDNNSKSKTARQWYNTYVKAGIDSL